MNRFLVPAFAAVMALSVGGAFAATVTSTIKSMDAKAHTVTLHDGRVYHLPMGHDMSMLKAGEKVKVTFENKAGKHEATEIVAAK